MSDSMNKTAASNCPRISAQIEHPCPLCGATADSVCRLYAVQSQKTDPIDILQIASQRVYYANEMVRSAMMMQSSPASQHLYDSAWTMKLIFDEDMDAVQKLIVELSR